MDWHNEIYVKLYTSDTPDDLLLSWEARAVWHEMLRKFDRSGIIRSRRGARGLAALIHVPLEVVDRALSELLEDGRIQVTEGGWIAPNFIAAQEAIKAGALRQKEYRERRRKQAITQSGNGTSREVTESDGALQSVTGSDSYLILSDLNKADSALTRGDVLSPEDLSRFERRTIPEDPGLCMLLDDEGRFAGAVRIAGDGSGVVEETPAHSRAG